MDKSASDQEIKSVPITRMAESTTLRSSDLVTIEAPLQIILRHGPRGNRQLSNLAMTMRTPGYDDFLARGYLFTENIIKRPEDIVQIKRLSENEILIELQEDIKVDLHAQLRNSYINSSCGICGKNHLDEIRMIMPYLLQKDRPTFRQKDILQWSVWLNNAQRVFPSTGGIHAAALVDQQQIHAIQEDIGRHNAVDKLIGFAITQYSLPLHQMAMVVSARASFELVQKALMAGIPMMAAIGAPSSLAIEVAEENSMTLIAFLRSDRFNVYTHPERVIWE